MTTNVDARLRVCHPCETEWHSATPCWHCGQPGTLTAPDSRLFRQLCTSPDQTQPRTDYEHRTRNELGARERQVWGAPPAVEGRPA